MTIHKSVTVDCAPDKAFRVLNGRLAGNKWMLGNEFSLVDCAYCPPLNLLDKAGFSFKDFPSVVGYLDALRARRAWKAAPKLPALEWP